MARKLKQLTVTAVALVPRGSNPGAHIALFKADATHAPISVQIDGAEVARHVIGKATFNDLLLAEQRQKALWKVADSIYTMQEAMYSALYADNPSADIRKSVTQFSAYVEKLLDALESGSLDGDPVVAKQLVQKKAEGVFARFFNQEPMTMSKSIATPPAPVTGTPEAGSLTDIQLAELPPHVQEFIKAQRSQTDAAIATAKAAQETADRATAAIAVETEKRERIEFEAIAKADLSQLPGTAEEKGAVLLSLAKALAPEEYQKAFTLLKAGAAAATLQTMEKAAVDGTLVVDASSASGQLDTIANELMKADPKMTKAVALTKAYRQRQDLYAVVAKEEEESGARVSRRNRR